jgi:hypothetical protein
MIAEKAADLILGKTLYITDKAHENTIAFTECKNA